MALASFIESLQHCDDLKPPTHSLPRPAVGENTMDDMSHLSKVSERQSFRTEAAVRRL